MTIRSKQEPVTEDMKVKRAKHIAALLNDPGKWHSHGRAIDMKTLRGEEIKLEIEDFEHDSALCRSIREYFDLLKDYMNREQYVSFVHTREYF